MSDGGNWKDLLKASEEGDVARARYHLNSGVDPNFQHPEYFTAPIHEAIKNGNLEIVKILVEQGNANPALIEELTDETTIEIARSHLQFQILDYLNTKVPPEVRFESRVILVTEGLVGIGKLLVMELLLKGHEIFFVCSSEGEAIATCAELREETGNPKLHFIDGEMDTIENVYKLAETVLDRIPQLNTLIHNASLWSLAHQTNENGLEVSFMVNYMAKHILNKQLSQLLCGNDKPRIIYVNPEAKWREPDLIDTPYGKNYSWLGSQSETIACSSISFLNSVHDAKKTSMTVMLVQAGKPHNSIDKQSSGCYGPLVEIAKAVFPEQPNVTNSVLWLAEEGHGENYHGKIYNVDKEEVKNYTEMNIPREWEQWTIDFLSRSSVVA